jgi:hypothetical protein
MLKVWTNLPEALIPEAVCCGVSEGRRIAAQPKRQTGPEGDFLALAVCDLPKAQRDALRRFAEGERSVPSASARMGFD